MGAPGTSFLLIFYMKKLYSITSQIKELLMDMWVGILSLNGRGDPGAPISSAVFHTKWTVSTKDFNEKLYRVSYDRYLLLLST